MGSPSDTQRPKQRLQARALASLFFIGVAVGALLLVFPHSRQIEDGPLLAVFVVGLLAGGTLWLRAERSAEWEIYAGLAVGTALVAGATYFARGIGLFPVIFTWLGVYAFYFFRMRVGLAWTAFAGVLYAIALLATDQPGEVARWLLAVGTALGGGLVIARLRGDVHAQQATATRKDSDLRVGEARTRAIVESAPDALVTLDRDGAIVMWNPAAERLFGFTADEAVGRHARDIIIRPEDVEPHLKRIARDFATPEREREANVREAELKHRDGTTIPVEMRVQLVRAGGEDVITTFITDLRDRMRRDEERLQLIREQAAREDAEQMAGIVHGLQMIIDAALANNRLDDMLAALLPRLCEVLHAEAAAILLADEEGALEVRATTAPGGIAASRTLALGEGIAGRVAAARQSRLDTDPDPDELSDAGLKQMASVLSAPLAAGDAITGVIQVGVPAPRGFREEELMLLSLAADRVALAIDHARIYEREHRIAETLQRSLLPERLPTLPGLEVSARYLPAAAEAEVGGDWYDVIPIHSGCIGLVMGDVAGKGLAAASMVGRLRSAVRAYALEGHDPSGVVDRLNQLVFSELDDGNMATLVYVVVDPGQGRVRWVNAGHLPPLIVAGGEATFLDGPGSVPLGVMPFPGYGAREAELPEDATVLLYTDGLIERPGELLDIGLERLGTAASAGDGHAHELCERVLGQLVPAAGSTDDVALLALHYPPFSERFHVHLPADPGELAAVRALLRRWLVHSNGSDDEIAEILTAAGEATANAIEHAGTAGGTGVDVTADVVDGHEIQITVRDSGRWRPRRDDEGGRGLVLMRALMDEVDVVTDDEGTTVTMTRALVRTRAG
jgi:PAS domain S-box-containing protein